MVEMLVNSGQEMDSARDCKYKFSINLVKKKPQYHKSRELSFWHSVYLAVQHA